MNYQDPKTFETWSILKAGMNHETVPAIKAILRSQGNWKGTDSTAFGPTLKAAVQYFQSTHLGPHGEYLKGDGEVGPMTWWALYNPSGTAQSSKVVPVEVEKKTDDHITNFEHRYGHLPAPRKKFLEILWEEYYRPVKEIPDGSNKGPHVDKYTEGYGAVYWCALFLSWCYKEAIGVWHKAKRRAGVMDWFNAGLAGGYAYKLGSGYKPVPGDFMVWKYAKGAGHISAIVACNMDRTIFNTLGGNEGNRVKLGIRRVKNEPQLVGFIRPFDDEGKCNHVLCALLSVKEEDAMTAGGTR